jgi:hypothetical protein
MRKLSVVMAALFLLGSAPAFAQGSGGSTEPAPAGGAMGAGSSDDAGTTTKKSKKAKKAKKAKKGAADAGM